VHHKEHACMLIYVCTSTTDLMLASETIKVTTLYTYNFGISYIYISMYISEREIKETIKFLYGKHNTSTPCTISKPRVCMHVRQHMNRSMHACRPRATGPTTSIRGHADTSSRRRSTAPPCGERRSPSCSRRRRRRRTGAACSPWPAPSPAAPASSAASAG